MADIPKVMEQLNNAFGFEENEVIQVLFPLRVDLLNCAHMHTYVGVC